MKNLLLIAVLSLTFSFTSFANNNPSNGGDETIVLLTNDIVDCASSAINAPLINVTFSENSGEIFYEALDKVRFVQVLDDAGELVYQLPIGSKKVYLSINDFDQGNYSVNFLIDSSETMVTTSITKK